eukprot:Sspe_Gene.71130::Locus_42107_Transcript_1_1_Confidence_1.000_Length_1271::g.71130::m.71130
MAFPSRVACLRRLGRQCRNVFLTNAPRDSKGTKMFAWNLANWEHVQYYAAASTEADEKVRELFGSDAMPWVHVVKEASNLGVVDPEAYTVWEAPLYYQSPELRNDWLHKWKESVPEKAGYDGKGVLMLQHDENGPEHYLGMFPDKDAESPGAFWRRHLAKFEKGHMLWKRVQERELARYGGIFGLPIDQYQTHNGVLPLLSPTAFRKMKYHMHEVVVRELNKLNAAAGNRFTSLKECHDIGGATFTKAVALHHGFTVFVKSILPRGGALTADVLALIEDSFGSKEAMFAEVCEAAKCVERGFVWIVWNNRSEKLEVQAVPYDESILSDAQGRPGLAALAIFPEIWSLDYDSKEEFVERFSRVFDYQYLLAAYADATGQPRPEPLVF